MTMEEMKLLAEGLQLIEEDEFCVLTAYRHFPKEPWTIGFGHTKDVVEGMTCTREQAEQWLKEDIDETCRLVKHALQVTLNNYQFSALVCLTFNIGYGRFRDSEMLKLIHAQEIFKAADEFVKFDHVGGNEVAGLRARRLAEKELFLTGLSRPPTIVS
jgi:lysozyme